MKKLNNVLYNKLFAQAEEAKEQGKIKLAACIYDCIGAQPENEKFEYSYSQLNADIQGDLWKAASNVMKYHGIESVDAEKIDEALTICAEMIFIELDRALGIEPGSLGPFEPKLMGEIDKS